MNTNIENDSDGRGLLVDMRALRESERKAKEARDYAELVIESIPPFLVLDSDLRVQSANESFCEHFRVERAATEHCLVYDLGNGQWNIPPLRAFLEEILPRNTFFKNFEVTHEFESIGRRTMLLSGRQVDHIQRILLFINDVTDTLRSQESLHISEVRYRRLFEAARDGILILDPTTRRIEDANPFMSELLGYPHNELLGKELWEIGLLKDEEASRTAFGELQEKGYIRYEDLPLQTSKGVRREVEFVSNLYQENSHKVIQCNIRDITDRKRTEGVLRVSEERFRVLFELGPIGVYSCDASGTVQEFNRRSVELWGREPAEGDTSERFCGSLKLYSPDGMLLPHAQCPMARVLNGELRSVRDQEAIIERPDGSRITVIINIVSLRDERGKITGAINCFFDITERKRSEEALAVARNQLSDRANQLEGLVVERTARLQESVGELGAYSYSIAHDMRAPLRAMRGFSTILLEDHATNLNAEGREYLEKINTAAARMDSLIQDVLTYTRVAGEEITMDRLDVNKLVREVIESYPQLQTPNAEIQIEGVLPKVIGNDASLAQCLSNLLTNAVKFVARGTKPSVVVRAEDVGSEVRLWIEDNGIGIEPKDQKRIFSMFERVHPESAYEGTGIGLAIVRKAAERMGGSAGVRSEIGHGSKFWIQLKKG